MALETGRAYCGDRETARIRNAARIQGPRVTVNRYEGDPDYGAEAEEAFAKFKSWLARGGTARVPHDTILPRLADQLGPVRWIESAPR